MKKAAPAAFFVFDRFLSHRRGSPASLYYINLNLQPADLLYFGVPAKILEKISYICSVTKIICLIN